MKATGKNIVVSGAGTIGNFVAQFEKSEAPEKY
jgi:threonine dehydrogenase-like Zn-dependent dehydrogenase